MSVILNRIYVQNYKLFDQKEVIFSKGLSVFDGPNGYGKTSIFDAIELLVTGTIQRIYDNTSIMGNKSYDTNFLTKDSNQDVVIMGEFLGADRETTIIALRIPNSIPENNRTNNPKDTFKFALMYKLDKYDPEHIEWGNELNENEAAKLRNQLFGSQNVEYFTNYHYVQQEDRLGYFKKSEKDRLVEIQKLFGIEQDEKRYEIANKLHSYIKKQLVAIKNSIANKNLQIEGIRKKQEAEVEYTVIAGGKPSWDKREIGFNGFDSKQTYERYLNELIKLGSLVEFKEEYFKSRDLEQFERIPADIRIYVIRAWALDKKDKSVLEKSYNIYQKIIFLTEQLNLAEQQKYSEINYARICDILNLQDEKIIFKSIIDHLNIAQKNQTNLQNSISQLEHLRNNLFNHSHNIEQWENNKCPYCGQTWTDAKELEIQFAKTEKFINDSIGGENSSVKKIKSDLIKYFNDSCVSDIREYILSYKNDSIIALFSKLGTLGNLRQLEVLCDPILTRISVKFSATIEEDTFEDYVKICAIRIEEIRTSLSAVYLNARKLNEFDRLYKDYFFDNEYLHNLDNKKVELKKRYLQYQYEMSYDNTFKELDKLNKQRLKMEELQEQLSKYKDKLNDALKKYKLQVIKQMEIPFFLYSSRLLQSYQSGQGVMISSDGSNIKFTVPGKDHDVLYTMSSGQMSAVLLSFSLALNKIYAGDNFNTLFIDDPIQCMDDINMVSFVDLLRQEFSDSQIIMSTHEDTFSNFIKYKFDKFKKENKSINLRA